MGNRLRTYPRDWSAYNASQVEELTVVVSLIRDLVDALDIREFSNRTGRPPVDARDILKCCLVKEYLGLSDRRLVAWLWLLRPHLGLTDVPDFSTVCKHANDLGLKSYFEDLLVKTNQPIKDEEHRFSTDATGLGTKNMIPWQSVKSGHGKRRDCVKAHFTVGRKFKLISCVTVTKGTAGDSPQLPEHIEKTTGVFSVIYSWCADAAYLARYHCTNLWNRGILPFIKPRSNSTIKKKGSQAWRWMMELFRDHRDEFDRHYHGRSISETVNSTMKRLLNPVLRKKNPLGQVNEILAKAVVYNLIALTRAIFTLKIDLQPLFLN